MLLSNVVNSHAIGVNCCTTSMTTILRSYGTTSELTETDVFGFASGLGFIYQYYKDEGYFLSGRNESLEMNLCYVLGIDYIQGYSDDFDSAWSENKKYLDQGIPVIVDLNVEFLPYFKGYVEDGFRFGLHNAILVGYDEEHAYLLDHRWLDVKSVPLDLYKLARSLDNSSISPKNGWRVMLSGDCEEVMDKHTFYFALETMVNRMVHPFAFKLGLEGIRMFFREVKLWSNKSFDDTRIQNYKTASFLLEKLGTGGGNFRRMYSRFLKRSVGKYHLPDEFLMVSKMYLDLSKQWREISQLLEEMAVEHSKELQERFESISTQVYEKEKNAIELLKKLLEEGVQTCYQEKIF
jgi:hypothetical protein